jgi:hypothetical protein
MYDVGIPKNLLEERKQGTTLLIHALPSIGPKAGANILVVTTRKDISSIIDDITSKPKAIGKRILKNVVKCVRHGLMLSKNDALDESLCSDIVILFGFKLVLGSDKMLQASGLLSLLLLIDDDVNLTWQQRGMLDSSIVEKSKLDTRPTILR